MAGKLRNVLSTLIAIFISMIFCIPALAAQDPAFRLEADSLNLQKGVSSTIVISLINAQNAEIVSIDGLEYFDVLSQNSSTSTSIINNVSTYQADIYYAIMPKITGEFTLKATIMYEGSYYETNSLVVTVSENADITNGTTPELFVKTVTSHDEAYLGEKIIIAYEVYTRVNIDSLGFTEYLTIDGVISKELPNAQVEYETVYIDGYNYTKYTVKRLIIDPIRTGICVIPSFDMQINVITEDNYGGFGGFGGLMQTATPKYLQTDGIEILVKPLPSSGRPDNFSGIVGVLTLDGSYSRNELNYGDSLALQINMSGNCNLDGLKNIFNGAVEGFTIYENQKDTDESIVDNMYHAQKSFEAVLIPEKNGELQTPPVSISYFNPVTEKYETAELSGTTINVLGDMPQQQVGNGSQLPSGGYEAVLINQVSYGNISDGYFNIRIQRELLFTVIICVSVLVVISIVVVLIVANRRKRNTELKTMYNRLMSAREANEIYNSFNAMIKHCFGLNLKSNSQSGIMNSLPDSALASAITEIMNCMESAKMDSDEKSAFLKKKIKGIYPLMLRYSKN